MLRVLHAADIHLGSQLSGLRHYEGAPDVDIQYATRRAFERLIDLAIKEEVDLVVFAGDVFEGDWHDYNTGRHFLQQLARLRDCRIPVVMIRGNHDAANKMSRGLRMDELCTVLPHDRPVSHHFEDLGVVVHGQSYARRAVTDNIAARYPKRQEGFINIGLLHTALEGREGHEPYAPCTVEDLVGLGYDYWALGHIHQREVVHRDERTLVVFSGNTQGRHCREPGPKGVCIVEFSEAPVQLRFVPTHVIEWRELSVDVTGAENYDDVIDRLDETVDEFLRTLDESEGADLGERPEAYAVRVVLTGVTPVASELRCIEDRLHGELTSGRHYGMNRIWFEEVRVRAVERVEERDPLDPSVWKAIEDAQKSVSLADLLTDDKDLQALQKKLRKLEINLEELLSDEELREAAVAQVRHRITRG